jgi:hypothetical protein
MLRAWPPITGGLVADDEGFDADIDGFAPVHGGVAAAMEASLLKGEGVAAETRAWTLKVRAFAAEKGALPPTMGALPPLMRAYRRQSRPSRGMPLLSR